MRMWIICSGEAAVDFPSRCAISEYNTLRGLALDGRIEEIKGRRVAANGRRVFCSPRLSARETAEMIVEGAEAEIDELLDELPYPEDRNGRILPLWLCRLYGRVRYNGREQADLLIDKLEKTGEDSILISHPAMIAALVDALRIRGYCVQRTGLGRIKPFEQMLLSKRDEHCGGCQHNCLLSNPGCNIGRDKAARLKKN